MKQEITKKKFINEQDYQKNYMDILYNTILQENLDKPHKYTNFANKYKIEDMQEYNVDAEDLKYICCGNYSINLSMLKFLIDIRTIQLQDFNQAVVEVISKVLSYTPHTRTKPERKTYHTNIREQKIRQKEEVIEESKDFNKTLSTLLSRLV